MAPYILVMLIGFAMGGGAVALIRDWRAGRK